MILQLCRDVMNLEVLIQNSTVMGALTRVLQDEHKKSVDLTFNILR
jgi:Kinesin-associated protein (KAP)